MSLCTEFYWILSIPAIHGDWGDGWWLFYPIAFLIHADLDHDDTAVLRHAFHGWLSLEHLGLSQIIQSSWMTMTSYSFPHGELQNPADPPIKIKPPYFNALLVVWNIPYFSIYWEQSNPNWLSYFSGLKVETTNQLAMGVFFNCASVPRQKAATCDSFSRQLKVPRNRIRISWKLEGLKELMFTGSTTG